jgi:hypothetical protein
MIPRKSIPGKLIAEKIGSAGACARQSDFIDDGYG